MTLSNKRLSLEEVLDEFFFNAEKPTTTMVIRACEAYPEYREDIMEFAALWTSYENANESAETISHSSVSEEDVSRLQSFILSRLDQLDNQSKSATQSDVEGAKKALASLAGANLRRAAAAVGLGGSTILLQKILTNSITNVPKKIFTALSSHMNVALALLQETITGNCLAVGRRYSATDKPTTPQKETWERAVRSLSLSKEEIERLLNMQEKE
jgi:hypothetical protein